MTVARRPGRIIALAAILLALLLGGVLLHTRETIGPEVKRAAAPTPVRRATMKRREGSTDLRSLPVAEQLRRASLAAWRGPDGAVLDFSDEVDGTRFADRVRYKPGRLLWADFGPVLISEGEVIDAGHVHAGRVAVHYLRVAGDRFEVARAFPEAVIAGSMGVVGDWRIDERLRSHPVLAVEGGGTWQGYTCATLQLFELSPDGPRDVFAEATVYSNGGTLEHAAAPITIEGELTNVRRDIGFDITHRGTRAFTNSYAWQLGKAVLIRREGTIETC